MSAAVLPIKPPKPTKCPSCGAHYAGIVCPICKEESTTFSRPRPSPCRYFVGRECDCDARGLCLDVA